MHDTIKIVEVKVDVIDGPAILEKLDSTIYDNQPRHFRPPLNVSKVEINLGMSIIRQAVKEL